MGPFTNIQRAVYWAREQYAPDTTQAWYLNFGYGFQFSILKTGTFCAWAVRDRDIDADQDQIAAGEDNCTLVANPGQLDTDGDGFGKLCDGDLNQRGLTTATDFNLLRSGINLSAGTSALCAAADMNGSGLVTSIDFNLLRARLNLQPGPSGVCTHGATSICPWQAGDVITYSQSAYGADPSNNAAAALLQAQYGNVYGPIFEVGLAGGSGYSIVFTSAGSLLAYLPANVG